MWYLRYIWMLIIVLFIFATINATVNVHQARQINKLNHEVSCLQRHHQASC